jgi:mRNA interferase MazF
MKTAVSIPDELFQRADALAQRVGKSRSQVYREALAEYLYRRETRSVTEALDEVVDELEPGRDPWLDEAGRRAVPTGSEPGFRRPVVVVQGDAFNASRLATVVVVPLTSNLRWAAAPGNVLLAADRTGLPKDSVANVSQLVAVDRDVLSERVGHLDEAEMALLLAGIDVVLGRD